MTSGAGEDPPPHLSNVARFGAPTTLADVYLASIQDLDDGMSAEIRLNGADISLEQALLLLRAFHIYPPASGSEDETNLGVGVITTNPTYPTNCDYAAFAWFQTVGPDAPPPLKNLKVTGIPPVPGTLECLAYAGASAWSGIIEGEADPSAFGLACVGGWFGDGVWTNLQGSCHQQDFRTFRIQSRVVGVLTVDSNFFGTIVHTSIVFGGPVNGTHAQFPPEFAVIETGP